MHARFAILLLAALAVAVQPVPAPTLRDVILFYERGGVRNPHLDTQLRPLKLSPGDIDALIDFLQALNGESFIDLTHLTTK